MNCWQRITNYFDLHSAAWASNCWPSGGVLIDLARDETSPHRNVTFPSKRIGSAFPTGIGKLRDSLRMTPGTAEAWRKKQITQGQSCLPLAIATCYARSVNRNIFYIIGVIVVIIIVLKVLGLF